MSDPVLVWGGGAVGGTFAAYLARAGRSVTIVDLDRAHLDAINGRGLRMSAPGGGFVARARALHPDEVSGRFREVFVAVKAHHTQAAARAVAPLLSEDAAVVSLQNGLCELQLAEVIGGDRIVGAFINFGADVTGPGEILHGNRGAVVVGELDGRTRPRTEQMLALLREFEPDAILTDNIWGYLWGKLAYSAILKASGLAVVPMVEFIGDARLLELHVALVREVLDAARAAGVHPIGFNGFDPVPFAEGDAQGIAKSIRAMADFNRASAKTHSSTWRDLAVFRQQTDAAAQLAPVFAIAEKNGVPMPCNRRMIELIRSVEEGRAVQGDDLIRQLRQAAAQ